MCFCRLNMHLKCEFTLKRIHTATAQRLKRYIHWNALALFLCLSFAVPRNKSFIRSFYCLFVFFFFLVLVGDHSSFCTTKIAISSRDPSKPILHEQQLIKPMSKQINVYSNCARDTHSHRY